MSDTTLLVVDDEPDLETVREAARRLSWSVVVSTTPALDPAQLERVSVVVCRPDRAAEIAPHARAARAAFLIALGRDDDPDAVTRAGADDWVAPDSPPGEIARRLSFALERASVGKEAAAQQVLLAGVSRALTILLAAERPGAFIDAALAELAPATGADRVYVARHDRDDAGALRVALVHEWTAPGVPRLLGRPDVAGRAPAIPNAQRVLDRIDRGEIVAIALSELPPDVQDRLQPGEVRSMLVVPISAEGRCWGQIGFVDCRSERRWNAAARAILQATAAAIGSAIVRARVAEELAEQLDRVRSLYESTANPALGAREQLARLLEVGARHLRADVVGVLRIQPADVDACELAYVHPVDAPTRPGTRVPFERRLWEVAVAENRAVAIADVGAVFAEAGGHRLGGFRALLGTPLWVRGQAWGGVVFLGQQPRERPFRETDGDLARLIARGVAHAIEHIEAEAQRHALEASLRENQKLESLGLLAGGIAHDFNNLLMGIVGQSGLAREALADENAAARRAARACLEQIDATARRAADLTRQLLAYAGRAQFRFEPTCLATLVREMSTLLSVVLPKDARIVHQMDEPLPPVLGDTAQLQQLVMNLITNAGEALGGAPGTITIGARTIDLPSSPPARGSSPRTRRPDGTWSSRCPTPERA